MGTDPSGGGMMEAEATRPDLIPTVEAPGELWMLWNVAEHEHPGSWVCSFDDAPGGATYLVAFSRAEAEAAAAHQNAIYECVCIPVRVK